MDEVARLGALARYDVLDSPPELAFDRISAVVARSLDVPIALVSLIDRDRQWFKACVGLDVSETPRGVAFCAHAIESDAVFVVPDAAADPRFATNPLVVGAPHIRAYAGAPLVVPGGHRIGTLCAIDRRPRSHTAAELATLRDLAAVVVELLEKRAGDRDQQLLRSVGATSPNVGYVYDLREGRAVWVTANAGRVLGFDATDAASDMWGRVHPDDRAPLTSHYERLAEATSDEPREITYRVCYPDGPDRWLLSREAPYARDARGEVTRVVGIAIDVSPLKAAEQRALESERALAERLLVLEGVLESAGEGILFADATGQLQLANSIARDLIGRAPPSPHPDAAYVSEVGIFHDDERTPFSPEELPLARALCGEVIQPTAAFVRNSRHPDGVHLTVNGQAIRDVEGHVRGAVVTLANVTAERTARRAAATSEASFRALIEALSLGVFVQRGDVLYANSALATLLGHTPAELIGRDYCALIHPEDRAMVAARIARARAGQPNPPTELRLMGRDGPVAVEANGIAIDFAGATAILVMCRDVRAERAAAARLLASLREKEVLLREIHHRVKNNLAVISSLLHLQARVVNDTAVRAAFDETRARIQSISLVHEHLYQSPDLGHLDLGAYLTALTAQIAVALGADRRGLALTVAASAIEIDLDAALPCGLIVNELVTNALKHGFPDRRAGRVTIAVVEHRGQIEVVVADDGVGMPASIEIGTAGSLGFELIGALVAQLRGTLAIDRVGGTTVRISFPKTA